jgi:proline iminopeptidase
MGFERKSAGAATMMAIIYGALVRPRLWRWGATDDEVTGSYPGAELVPEGERGATMAVTIEAPSDLALACADGR